MGERIVLVRRHETKGEGVDAEGFERRDPAVEETVAGKRRKPFEGGAHDTGPKMASVVSLRVPVMPSALVPDHDPPVGERPLEFGAEAVGGGGDGRRGHGLGTGQGASKWSG